MLLIKQPAYSFFRKIFFLVDLLFLFCYTLIVKIANSQSFYILVIMRFLYKYIYNNNIDLICITFQGLICIIRGIMSDLQSIREVMNEMALQGKFPLGLINIDYMTVYSMVDCFYSPRRERMLDIFSKLTGTAELVRDCVYALVNEGGLFFLGIRFAYLRA